METPRKKPQNKSRQTIPTYSNNNKNMGILSEDERLSRHLTITVMGSWEGINQRQNRFILFIQEKNSNNNWKIQ